MSHSTEKETAKKSAKKGPTKKRAAKKSTAKKAAPKKSAAKKSTQKGSPKKAAVKKTPAPELPVLETQPEVEAKTQNTGENAEPQEKILKPEAASPSLKEEKVEVQAKAAPETEPKQGPQGQIEPEGVAEKAPPVETRKSAPVPDGSRPSFEPEIVVLYCQNSVAEGARRIDSLKHPFGFKVKELILPCSSNAEIGHMVKILEQGADGLQVVGCSDQACRFLKGSMKAEKRVDYVRNLLEEIDYGSERIGMARGGSLSAEELLDLARQRADEVRPLGPNPMRA